MAAPDSSDFVWSASNLARVSRASSRSRSRSATNHSSNGASVTPRPSSRSPRYRSTACWRASGSALRGKPLEREDVDVERGSVQRHGVLVEAQARRYDGKPPAKDEQHLAEIGTSLPVVHIRPEQRGELVPWTRL